jgi:hypothetical protein
MAKYTPNPLFIRALRGAIGDLVFYVDAEGQLIVKRKGQRKAPPSEKQLARNELFRLASVYGNRVKLDPALAAEYRQICRGRMQPYHVGMRDFLTPPSVAAIDLQAFNGQPGQLIHVVATDDSRVMGVEVILRNAASDAILERGPAGLSTVVDEWLYTTQTLIPSGTSLSVEATATDRPGNMVTAKVPFLIR